MYPLFDVCFKFSLRLTCNNILQSLRVKKKKKKGQEKEKPIKARENRWKKKENNLNQWLSTYENDYSCTN